MKTCSIFLVISLLVFRNAEAQDLEMKAVPPAVKSALQKKYPEAKAVKWEKEKGNYEANWGGKSGEDNSVQFTPAGQFIEIVNAIPVNELPEAVKSYVKEHFNNSKISEAGRITDAKGKLFFEAEIQGKDLIFSSNGDFLKND